MSRFARTNGHTQGAPIAGLYERNGAFALVIVRARGRTGVALARTFSPGQETELIAALSSAGVGRLVRIAPARRTVCRVAPVPPGSPDELAAAASLMAEASLPDEIPAHRRGAGILPGSGPAGAHALLTAWRTGDDTMVSVPWPDQRWTTEIAALAVLAGGRGAAVAARHESGAISIIAPGVGRTAARVLIETTETRAAWDAAVARHLSETCASVGAEAPEFSPRRELLLTDSAAASLRSGIDGVPSDPAWLDTYGLALGAALVALSPEPGAQRLAQLTDEPPWQRAPWPERAAGWMGVPRNAAAVIAMAIVIALLSPLGFAAARVAVLTKKTAGLPDQDKLRAQIQQRAAVYREMEQVRWPMTKLLADISAATPEGVTVDSITLAPDQGLAFKGNAESQQLLTQLQKNLNDTHLFEKLKVARAETTSSGVSFDVSAEVISPHTPVKPVDDFATKPLVVRLYGEGATAGPSDDGSRSDSGNGGRRAGREDRGDRRGRGSDGPSARPTPAKLEIPAPLSDEQIAAMSDFGTVLKEWTNRQRVANSGQADAAAKARLEHEVEKLKERRDALKQAGGAK